jgi:hypothetical protein
MNCPECGLEMKSSNIVIDTYPPTHEYYCKNCNAVWDVCDTDIHECFTSPRLTTKNDVVVEKKVSVKVKLNG